MKNLGFRTTTFIALAALAFSSLPFGERVASRRLPACADGSISGGPLNLSGELFDRVQDESLKSSARDWYYYLSQVELRALTERQAIFGSYGLNGPLFPDLGSYGAGVATLVPVSTTMQFPLAPSPSPTPFTIGFPGFQSVQPVVAPAALFASNQPGVGTPVLRRF